MGLEGKKNLVEAPDSQESKKGDLTLTGKGIIAKIGPLPVKAGRRVLK